MPEPRLPSSSSRWTRGWRSTLDRNTDKESVMPREAQECAKQWEGETQGTLALMDALPREQYNYRPDAGGRSIGELAWHLAEVDAYVSLGIERAEFRFEASPPPPP